SGNGTSPRRPAAEPGYRRGRRGTPPGVRGPCAAARGTLGGGRRHRSWHTSEVRIAWFVARDPAAALTAAPGTSPPAGRAATAAAGTPPGPGTPAAAPGSPSGTVPTARAPAPAGGSPPGTTSTRCPDRPPPPAGLSAAPRRATPARHSGTGLPGG